MSVISEKDFASENLFYSYSQGANFLYVRIKEISQKNHISYSSLDFFDYIPIVSNISGIVRGIFGAVETMIGIPALPIQLLGRIVFKPTEKGYSSFLFNKGISNIIRGSLAQGPIISNIALYIYDQSPSLKFDFQKACGINN